MPTKFFDIKLINAAYEWLYQSSERLRSIGGNVPCVISASPAERCSVVLGASGACEKFDIQLAEPLSEALLKCADLLIIEPDYELYRKKSAELFELCSRFGCAKMISFDECLIEIPDFDDRYFTSFESELFSAVKAELSVTAYISASNAYTDSLNKFSYAVDVKADASLDSAFISLAGMAAAKLKIESSSARLFSLSVTDSNGITRTFDKRLDIISDDAEMIYLIAKSLYDFADSTAPLSLKLSLFDLSIKSEPAPAQPVRLQSVKEKFRRKTSYDYYKESKRYTKIFNEKFLKKYSNLCEFIEQNPLGLEYYQLCAIAERANTRRLKLGDYYINYNYAMSLINELPELEQGSILISGYCPFLLVLLLSEYYGRGNISFYFSSTDAKTTELVSLLDKQSPFTDISLQPAQAGTHYDLVIGRSEENCCCDYELLIVKKSFFETEDRKQYSKRCISKIIDFGKDGFIGGSSQFAAVIIDNLSEPSKTLVTSIEGDFTITQSQGYISDDELPCWVIYRNESFDAVYSKMQFGVFNVFCDNQIKPRDLISSGGIKIISPKQIDSNGAIELNSECSCIAEESISAYDVYKYVNADNLYLAPKNSSALRLARKPKGTAPNTSLAILIPKDEFVLSDDDLKYYSSEEFREFYDIALNHQPSSLSGDYASLYFLGKPA